MEKKSKRRRVSSSRVNIFLFCFLVFVSIFQGTSSAASQLRSKKKPTSTGLGSSIVLPVSGNVYPLGFYSVSVKIGNPPKLFDLDIDTGSDLTWVQCDAPCSGCTKVNVQYKNNNDKNENISLALPCVCMHGHVQPADYLYKPKKNLVPCANPLCSAINSLGKHQCESSNDQCDYEVQYADAGSSLGVLVLDYFPLGLTNGSVLRPQMAFGCGYDQKYPGLIPPPTSGVLGLGNGKTSIISQLQTLGVMKNVVGHCLSRRGGGFLFFGDHLVPASGISWTPMLANGNYASGPAELLFDKKTTGIKGLQLIFDSGSSYSYFNGKLYKGTLDLVRNDLSGKSLKDAPEEKALPICWKGARPFKSINDVGSHFKPLALSFTNAKNVQLQLPPEDYLIVTKDGNVCLGILNGSEVGLGNFNVIGDIFLQDKMVIYDNDKNQIGWVSANCDKLPKS